MITIDIKENYNNYIPPFNAKKTINTLLEYTDPQYLSGLKTIILTNSSSLSHDRRRETTWSKGHKLKIVESWGLYHETRNGIPASIELFVDNIFKGYTRVDIFLTIAKETILGEVYFHELGHHIHYSQHPEYAERETIAKKYTKKLFLEFLKKKYWYLYPLLKVINKIKNK